MNSPQEKEQNPGSEKQIYKRTISYSNRLQKPKKKLESIQKICLYAFFACLIIVGVLVVLAIFPLRSTDPDSNSFKKAEAFLQELKDGNTSNIPERANSVLVQRIKDQSTTNMPKEFAQSYNQALVHSWEITDIYPENNEIIVAVEISSLDPQSFSVSDLSYGLRDVLNETLKEHPEYQQSDVDLEMMSTELRMEAYDYLMNKLDEANQITLPVEIVLDSSEQHIIDVRDMD
ncbi:hypothetical protein BO224_09660 [Erysipelotrichaceae bacterium NYU-BL-E8]|uniref:Uncharacterized protein n=1 Tax=Ileibacterium valens TaxID=1862668 RepID=A0A1U7NGX6_9FIRM|nr:hypothetical protein [Ileibacterium valens]OLU38199.1 hypothetical protein BO224_09660 [Erysipelotrichaceae bacterium NYU-BL-E8]OLU40662.1 hypothetical protein BO222_04750 [Ileibacterium valens]OLU43328.1 hypothetical protein BM735_00650 [Erysipelotrichaceae bacterium NYU-BL-F16]